MKKIFTNPAFDVNPHVAILKTLLIAANVLVLGLDLLVHILFYDFPFVAGEELITALSLVGWASLFAVAISFAGFLGDAAIHYYHNRSISRSNKQPATGRTFTLDTHTHRPARA